MYGAIEANVIEYCVSSRILSFISICQHRTLGLYGGTNAEVNTLFVSGSGLYNLYIWNKQYNRRIDEKIGRFISAVITSRVGF